MLGNGYPMNNANIVNSTHAPAGTPTPAPTPPAAPVNTATQTTNQNDNERLMVLSHPSMNLIEITILRELNKQFPKVFALIMFVPGREDPSKQSGRTYVMDQREFIKFSIEELFQLAHAIEEAAITGSSDFIKFADTSKFAGGTQKNIKKVTVSAINNGGKVKIYINYKSDTANIATSFTKWSAIGFARQIEAIAHEAQIIDAKMKANRGNN